MQKLSRFHSLWLQIWFRLQEAIWRRDCSRTELDEDSRQKTSYRKKLDEVIAKREKLLAALDVKSKEEKKLKKLQEDIHAQNSILFDMRIQVKEVLIAILYSLFCKSESF